MTGTYYKQIDGKNYDKGMLDVVKKAKPTTPDGKPVIGIKLAEKLFLALSDGKEYTSIEKKTMKFIRDNYIFTPEADEYIRKEVRRFAALHAAPSKKKKEKAESSFTSDDSRANFYETEDDAADYRGLVEYHKSNVSDIDELEDKRKQRMIRIGLIVLFLLLLLGITWSVCRPKGNPSADVEEEQGFETIEKLEPNDKLSNDSKLSSETKESAKEKEVSNLNSESNSDKKSNSEDANKKDQGPTSASEYLKDPKEAAPVVRKSYDLNSRKSSISFVNHLQVPFSRNTEILTNEGRAALDELAKVLTKHDDLIVRVAGHTCWIGTQEDNQKLSEQRAKIVYDYLISKGVSSSNLESRGYGEKDTVASNSSQEGRMKNRRVEFTVLEIK
ncbi:MAG: OmpA family protein [Leptospiraceae bacterium]|nr:OmpA family protein [Leptospiraceae bacterium]